MEALELVTFRILDERNGIEYSDPLPETWPLEKWFTAVCDVPIAWFTVDNLARSCRQNIRTDAVMPYCLRALEFIPLAGEYEGQLLRSVLGIPPEYWTTHRDHRNATITACRRALMEIEDDEDLTREIVEWLVLQKATPSN